MSIIEQSDIHAFACAVHWESFLALAEGERRFMTGGRMNKSWTRWKRNGSPDKPYFLALSTVVQMAELRTRHVDDSQMHFVFALQDQYSDWAIQSYLDVIEVEKGEGRDVSRFGEIRFADPVKNRQLQPADLLCYSWQRFLRRNDEYHGWIVERARKDRRMGLFAAEHFEILLSKMPANERAALRTLRAP